MNRITASQTFPKKNQSDNYLIGQRFEKYIINLFNERHFKLEEWRMSKKMQAGTIPFTHSFPDLEVIFMGRRNHHFAIECKFMSKTNNGIIRWASERQIHIYKQFQKERNTTVFVAIGLGGEASFPEKLFVTPLNMIYARPNVNESDLLKYERKPTSRFFFDTVQRRLF